MAVDEANQPGPAVTVIVMVPVLLVIVPVKSPTVTVEAVGEKDVADAVGGFAISCFA